MWEDHIKRIAKSIGCDGDALKRQFEDVIPRARQQASTSNSKFADRADRNRINKEALKETIHKLNAHHLTKKMHPVDCIRQALIVYFMFGISTSGVEQSFAKSGCQFNDQRKGRSTPITEEWAIKLVLDISVIPSINRRSKSTCSTVVMTDVSSRQWSRQHNRTDRKAQASKVRLALRRHCRRAQASKARLALRRHAVQWHAGRWTRR